MEDVSSKKRENQPSASLENQSHVAFPEPQLGNHLRKPTERGKQFQIKILSQKRQTFCWNLARHMQSAYELLDTGKQLCMPENLEGLRDALDKSKEELNCAHQP